MDFKKFLADKGISDLSELSAEKQAGLFNEFNAEIKKGIDEAIEMKASKEDIEALKAELSASIEKQMVALNKALEVQGIALARMTRSENEPTKGLKEIIAEQREKLAILKNSSSANNNVKLTLKAVGDMSISGNTTGQIPQAFRNPVIGDVAERQVRLLDLVSTGTISSNLYEWVYVANEEGSAGVTAEAGAKNQIDFELIVGSQKVEKVTAYITVTDEMLDDVEGIATLINNKLQTKLLKSLETQVYSGSGTTPNLNGIYTVATAFSAGDFALAVDNANEVDVLSVAMNQIALAEQPMPTAIMMNPTDVTKLKVAKVSSTDKRYIERLQMIGGSLSMDGVQIIPTTLVTAGTYLVGDFSKASVLYKQGVTIEIGYNADNFVKNFKTIRAELRAVCAVENNDRTAFVKGTFATDKAALETA